MGAEDFFKKAGEEPNVESIPTISDEMKDTLKDKITGIDSRSLRDKSEPQINPEFVQWERNKDILRAIEIVNRSISHYDYINENPNNYNTESVLNNTKEIARQANEVKKTLEEFVNLDPNKLTSEQKIKLNNALNEKSNLVGYKLSGFEKLYEGEHKEGERPPFDEKYYESPSSKVTKRLESELPSMRECVANNTMLIEFIKNPQNADYKFNTTELNQADFKEKISKLTDTDKKFLIDILNKNLNSAKKVISHAEAVYNNAKEADNHMDSFGQPSMFAPHKQIMLATEWKYNSLIELEQLGKEINKKFANNIE